MEGGRFIDKPRVNDMYPATKPVELMVRAILHSSNAGDLVLDPWRDPDRH
jgi:DNA modification methylase